MRVGEEFPPRKMLVSRLFSSLGSSKGAGTFFSRVVVHENSGAFKEFLGIA
jgi:hypothetical protein